MQEQSQEYTVNNFFQDCMYFNIVAGKIDVDHQGLQDQVKLIRSELQELQDGLDANDPEEILDGAIDVAVTLFGLLAQLEHQGYHVQRAALLTAENNLTKFVEDEDIAKETVKVLSALSPGETFRYEKNGDVFVVFDNNNKVRKPVGYLKNNLADCLPGVGEE